MDEKIMLRTMIKVLKYGNYDNKQELMTILRNSVISYEKTKDFTRKDWQYWENILLRVPIPMLENANKYRSELEDLARYVYIETDDYNLNSLYIRPKPIELDNDEIIEHDVVFDEIKDTIIQGIRNAKYAIWVAVAWFTDEEIFKELLLKKDEGINIRIITSNEESNKHILSKLEENFDVKKYH